MSEKERDLAILSTGNGGDNNGILLTSKKHKKKKKNNKGGVMLKGKVGGKGSGGEPCMSKSKQKKLKKLQEEKERKAMLAKSIKILEKYKIREEDRSLLRSSGTIGQVQTMREKRLRAAQFFKAGLEAPEDDQPLKRHKNALSTKHDCKSPSQQNLDHVSEYSSCSDDLAQAKESELKQPLQCHQSQTTKCHSDDDLEFKSNPELISSEARQKEYGECLKDEKPRAFLVPCCSDGAKKNKNQDQEENELNLHPHDTTNASMTEKCSSDGPIIVHVARPKDVEENRTSLPIVMMEQEIMEAINENSAVIICGETGCGKTTQVPQFLYEAGYGSTGHASRKGMIGITQPRRVAVLATAKRVSFELGLRLGKEIGFQVRHDKMLGEKCSIKFMTDGILLRELQSDFLLRKYSIIILDEAHERSLNTDILIGMLSRIVQLRQKMYLEQQDQIISGVTIKSEDVICQLKLVLMSATLRVEDFISDRRLFHEPPPIIEVPTRQYPVITHFSKKTDVVNYVGQAYKKVIQIHRKLPPGGILVFVTGQREVEYLCRKLRKTSQEFTRINTKEKENADHESEASPVDVECGTAAIAADSSFNQEHDLFNTFEQDEDDLEKNSSSSDSDTENETFGDSDDEDINFANPNNTDTVLDFLKEAEGLASLKASFAAISGNEPAHDCKEHSSASVPPVVGCSMKSLFSPGPLHVLPLYARLPASSQLRVFEELCEGERLIVVATNVAETSLTIPGIKYVVDTGREKVRNYNHANGVETYNIQWISKASASQRAGRAGRTGPGHCYRLYSSAAFNNIFTEFSCPQITQIPVDGVVLLMKFMGINKVENFPFPTPPVPEAIKEAEYCLRALGAIDGEGKLKHIGKAMAHYPMSPRHSRMILTVVQTMSGQKATDRAHLILGYAVAAASALSFPDPFILDPERGHEGTDKADQVDKAVLQKQEKMRQKKQKVMAREARAKFCNPSSDALTISYALQLFELADDPVEFCRKNSLHHKTMDEMSKLRKQLLQLVFSKSGVHEEFTWKHGNFEDVEHAWRIHYDKHPLRMNEEEILGQALCAGWADRVAKRVLRVSELSEMDRKARAVQYQACSLNEIVFLHRRSSVSQTAPEFLIYTELIHSKRIYMHGITRVKPDWLVKYASALCSFSAPLTDPRPCYDPQTDGVLCWLSPSFGPHLWQLPLHLLPIKDDMLRVSVFACSLLEGKVLPCLKHVKAFLAAKPSSILRPEAAGQRRVADLVDKLKIGQRTIDSRAALREAWKKNPTILYPEMLSWFQDKFRGKFEELWSQMHSEVILGSHELFPELMKKAKKTKKLKKLN